MKDLNILHLFVGIYILGFERHFTVTWMHYDESQNIVSQKSSYSLQSN
jgi:hypothetical protein